MIIVWWVIHFYSFIFLSIICNKYTGINVTPLNMLYEVSEWLNCVYSAIWWQRPIRRSIWFWCFERMVRGFYSFCFEPFSEDSHKHVNTCKREIKGTSRLPEFHYFASGVYGCYRTGPSAKSTEFKSRLPEVNHSLHSNGEIAS